MPVQDSVLRHAEGSQGHAQSDGQPESGRKDCPQGSQTRRLAALQARRGRHAPACVRPALGCRPAGRQCQDGLRPSARQRVLGPGRRGAAFHRRTEAGQRACRGSAAGGQLSHQPEHGRDSRLLPDRLLSRGDSAGPDREGVRPASRGGLASQPEADPQGGSPAADDQPSQEKEDQTEQQVRCQAGSGRLAEGERQTIS